METPRARLARKAAILARYASRDTVHNEALRRERQRERERNVAILRGNARIARNRVRWHYEAECRAEREPEREAAASAEALKDHVWATGGNAYKSNAHDYAHLDTQEHRERKDRDVPFHSPTLAHIEVVTGVVR